MFKQHTAESSPSPLALNTTIHVITSSPKYRHAYRQIVDHTKMTTERVMSAKARYPLYIPECHQIEVTLWLRQVNLNSSIAIPSTLHLP
jgi:hypothetical protein